MRHPIDGTLRRLLDEPAGVALADREHVAVCDECQEELVAIRDDAELVHTALATDLDGVDVTAAWRRLSTVTSMTRPVHTKGPSPAGRFRERLRRPVVVG